jgi:hypothetical protein
MIDNISAKRRKFVNVVDPHIKKEGPDDWMVGTFCCQLLLSKEGMFFFSLCTFYKVESSLCGRNLNGVEWPSRGYFLALPGRKVSRLP